MLMGMEMANRRVVPEDLSGYRMRALLPPLPLEDAPLAGLREVMCSASRVKAQAEALRSRAAAELARRAGRGLAEKTLREQSGESTRGSRQEVETGSKLKELPGTKKAFGDGEITSGHARIIAKVAEDANIDEDELVDKAKKEPVDVFAHTARKHAQQRSGDDGMSALERQRRARKAWIRTDRGTGMTVFHAQLDPITGARIKNALSKKTDQLWRDEDPKFRPSTGQRMADALAGLLCPEDDDLKPGSSRTTLVLVAHYDPVTRQLGDAHLGDGTPLPVDVLRDLACRSKILPTVFGAKGQVLWAGMSRRAASPTQRMLLVARDRGCVGCGADAAWCQAHHVVPWAAGGPTDIDNLCLLCSRCHHRVHDQDWEISQTPQGKHILQPPSRNNRRSLPLKTPARGRSP
jgi:5-methylcytosine-specific restriction protein A